MKPEVVKICRICSIMDVKLYDLRSHPLECYYESVIGINPQYANLPPYACYECAALVRKFYFFRQKCLRSQAVLYDATDSLGNVKAKKVKSIDRKGIHIASNLKIVTLPNIEISLAQRPKLNIEVKLEQGSDDKYDKVKLDHNYASLNSMDPCLSSDDDDPLSLHNEKKSQNNDSDDEKVNLEEECEGLEFAVGTQDSGYSIEFTVGTEDSGYSIEVPTVTDMKHGLKTGTIKREKQLLNRKVAGDDKRNDVAHYINVITLTLEAQKEEIQKRKESSNYLNSPFQCNLCYKGFIDNDAWNHHVSKHALTAGSIECQVCKIRFKTKRAYQKHASIHEKKYACSSCPYLTTNRTQAKKHQGESSKGNTFKCKHCDEIFTIKTTYMSHMHTKHPSEFICGFCGYPFISKHGLALHETMMHKDLQEKAEENSEEGPYCEECDVRFISTEAYKRHTVMSTKHTQTTDSMLDSKGCRTCGATFENSEELRLHHRKEHKLKRPKKEEGKKPSNHSWPAKCEHCPAEIPNARQYWIHFRRVHPDKKYPIQRNHICDICGKDFSVNAFLIYHRRTHFEERAYKCSQCDKAFHNRTNLNLHEKTHSDDRPYPCSVCFKAFKAQGALTKHFRSHTGQKPFECQVCGKAFSQSSTRKLHVLTVHMKQPAPYVSRKRLERRKQGPKEPEA